MEIPRVPGRVQYVTRGDVPFIKDLFERVTAGLLLVGLSPLLAGLAAAIKLDTPGPALYRQRRVGLRGHPFELLKFRTMTVGAEHQGMRWETSRQDTRVTRVGRLLRRFSLDELPQLINVVRGEMALIGPRPALAHQVTSYTARQLGRLEMKPGLTGLAQVSGRNELDWDARIELDLWYIEQWSPLLDLRILLRTPATIVSGSGLYGRDGVVRDKH